MPCDAGPPAVLDCAGEDVWHPRSRGGTARRSTADSTRPSTGARCRCRSTRPRRSRSRPPRKARRASPAPRPGRSTRGSATPRSRRWRSASPTLEGGCGAVGTATGMAAVSVAFLALLRQGDHVVGTHPLYGPTRGLLEKYFTRLRRHLDVRAGGRHRGAARRDPAGDAAGLRRDAGEPDARPRRSGRGGQARARGRGAAGGRQHLRRPAPAAPDRARRRRRAALDDEVAQRPRRRGGRDRRGARAEGAGGARATSRDAFGVDDGPAPGVAGAARDPHPRDARRARAGQRPGARGVARGAPGGRVGALPGPAVAPAVRAGEAADGRPRRGDRLRAARRRRRRPAADERGQARSPWRCRSAASSR